MSDIRHAWIRLGGMHFRHSVEVGATLGEHVADWVAFGFRARLGHDEEGDLGRR